MSKEPSLLARLLRRAKCGDVIETSVLEAAAKVIEAVPVLSFVDLETALLREYRVRRQGSTLFLSDSKAGSFRPQAQTALILPLFIKDYLAKENLSQHWRESLPADFAAWILITAPEFNKTQGDLIAYGVNKTVREGKE